MSNKTHLLNHFQILSVLESYLNSFFSITALCISAITAFAAILFLIREGNLSPIVYYTVYLLYVKRLGKMQVHLRQHSLSEERERKRVRERKFSDCLLYLRFPVYLRDWVKCRYIADIYRFFGVIYQLVLLLQQLQFCSLGRLRLLSQCCCSYFSRTLKICYNNPFCHYFSITISCFCKNAQFLIHSRYAPCCILFVCERLL